jgi:flagellar assembly protein FliH
MEPEQVIEPEAQAQAQAQSGGESNIYPDAAALVAQATLLAKEMISEAKTKAERIVMDARNEVAALLLSAREQAEEDRRRAWQEGFAEGTEEGRRSFDEQLAEKARLNDESLQRVLDELYEDRTRTYNGLEKEVVTLALEIVRKVYGPAEEELGNVYESLIKNALKQIDPDNKVIIRVGPAEYERFFSSGNAVFELDSGVTVTASILRDVSLEEGDCLIDTDETTINAGLDSQLKYIKLAFEQAGS